MTPAERKRAQRQRDKLAGWAEVKVRIAADQAQVLRDFAATLPPPELPTDPRQLSLIEQLNRSMEEGDTSQHASNQGSLF